ncbi:putative peptidoglycan glycosyltransferase FtsW [Maritimibacter sp. DP1N21-5]|uniref:peptidoglycan glycosyltransferase FtsW n=1 Tax=Maritimibacter sp. DP1N21-5 TaxID=2836867 RepID=UPI001C4478CD|nr:putative peptidoglycan glycosyltransferase FtsW [Maritimibacter sp. DP1N21-5]MBV7409355.1 putative lipid II flippase FtsW [Maritimibacter sp. DP1N21-5]
MTEMVYGAVTQTAKDPILPRWWRTIDKWSVSCILLLFAIGLLLGLAASPPLAERNGLPPFYYVQRQLAFGIMAFATLFAMTLMSPKMVRRLGVVGFVITFAAIVLLPMFGTDFGKGAVRWYSLGFASFQPSEFLKPFYVVVAAWLMAASQEIQGPPGRSMSLALTLVIVGFLAMQPDFGQSALVLFGWGVMYFLAGASYLLIVGVVGLVVLGGFVAYENSEHFARRIDGFLSPDVDPRTQLGYATNAIQQGGFFGVGVGEGQVKWSLPDAHTDFIIAVAAEEYGLLLVLLIIVLYMVIVVRSFLRLINERDTFIRLAGTGLAAVFGVQALINMGVAVRLLPAKGMTLPFVSYGGSSLIAMGISVGMLIAFTRTRPQGKIEDYLTQRGGR